MREVSAAAGMLLMFVASQLLSLLLLRPFDRANVRGFEDPTDWKNGVILIGIILFFTALILVIARLKRERFIQWLILGSVGLTLVYVFFPLLLYVPSIDLVLSLGIATVLAALLTWLLYRFPEWYVVDVVGILIAAGGIAIFGTSFTPVTYLIVLVGTAVYDYISVYKTKHMLSLADSVLTYHLPIMLVVPKSLDYSFLEEKGQLRAEAIAPPPDAPAGKRPRDAMFLGLGDVVIPSIFAVTALQISGYGAAGAMLGIIAGFLLLMTFVLRGRPQAGLPALNGGALLGFLAGFYLERGTVVFWT